VSRSGIGGVFLGCFGTRPCVGNDITLKHSGATIAHRSFFKIAANDGGIVHLTLTHEAKRLLTHGHLDATAHAADVDGPSANAALTLVPFGTGGTAASTTAGSAAAAATTIRSTVKLFGHTGFVSRDGTAGIFLGCFGTHTCAGQMTIHAGHTLIGGRGSIFVAPNDGGIVHLTLTPTGQSLLKRNHHLTVKIRVADTDGAAATGTVTLEQFS
jgi:hypothetical protein